MPDAATGTIDQGLRRLPPGTSPEDPRCRPAGAEKEHDSPVVATYAGGVLQRDEVEAWSLYRGLPDGATIGRDELEQLALAELLAADAIASGLDRDPAIEAEMRAFEVRLLVRALRREIGRETVAAPDEVERELRRLESSRHRPRRTVLRNLFVGLPPDPVATDREAARHRLLDLRRRLLDGEDFGELAKAESDSQTGPRGGRMGVARPGDLPPAIEEVVARLEEGELSEIVESETGFSIFWAERVLPESTLPLEEARQRIEKQARLETAEATWRDLRHSAESDLEMRIDPAWLAAPRAGSEPVVSWCCGEALTGTDLAALLGNADLPAASEQVVRRALVDLRMAAYARLREVIPAPETDARRSCRRLEALGDAMTRRLAEAEGPPTDTKLRELRDRLGPSAQRPEQVSLRAIRVPLPTDPAGHADLIRELRRARDSLMRRPETFGDVAVRYSDFPRAPRGEPIWLDRRAIYGLGSQVAFAAKTAEPGDPPSRWFVDGGALWMIQVLDVRPPADRPLEEIRPGLVELAVDQRVREMRASRRSKLDLRLVDRPRGETGGPTTEGPSPAAAGAPPGEATRPGRSSARPAPECRRRRGTSRSDRRSA